MMMAVDGGGWRVVSFPGGVLVGLLLVRGGNKQTPVPHITTNQPSPLSKQWASAAVVETCKNYR